MDTKLLVCGSSILEISPARVCNTCNIERPIDHFPKQKSCKGGYRPVCKICVNGKLSMTKEERKDKSNIIKTQKNKLSEK